MTTFRISSWGDSRAIQFDGHTVAVLELTPTQAATFDAVITAGMQALDPPHPPQPADPETHPPMTVPHHCPYCAGRGTEWEDYWSSDAEPCRAGCGTTQYNTAAKSLEDNTTTQQGKGG